jgi:tRNA-dihydrouridine synthase 2
MVRVGTLPMRLLALEYGADIVYSEELVDKSLIKTNRVVNEALNTIDYVREGNKLIFRTCAADYPNVLQLGTADATLALQAAQQVSRDVLGIDVNMGCPKRFSMQGGMGAVLLSKPETAHEILTKLVNNLDNPVTCKIRLLDTVHETVDFVKTVVSTGIQALAIHARTRAQRPADPASWELLKQVIDAANVSIPVIVNGDVFKHEDVARVKLATGADSVMIARGACMNLSVFGKKQVSTDEVMKDYLRMAIKYDAVFPNAKYVLQHMTHEAEIWPLSTPHGHALNVSKKYQDLCDLFGMREEYETAQKNLAARNAELKEVPVPVEEYLQETAMPLSQTPNKRKAAESVDRDHDSYALNEAVKRQKVVHHAGGEVNGNSNGDNNNNHNNLGDEKQQTVHVDRAENNVLSSDER